MNPVTTRLYLYLILRTVKERGMLNTNKFNPGKVATG